MEHPSDHLIEGYANRTLAPEDLLAVDDHVAGCDACRSRAAVLAPVAAPLAELRSDLLPVESHLTDEQVGQYVGGGLTAGEKAPLQAHLGACATCAREVEELRAWARKRPGTHRLVYAAAAAVLFLVLVPVVVRWRSGPDPEKQPSVAGLEALPAQEQQRVRASLEAGVAQPPAYLSDLRGRPEALMGGPTPESFRLVEPIATVSVSDRPTFRWQPLAGAEAYTVSVSDEALRPVAESPPVTETVWTPAQPLSRGRVYVWQVTAHRRGERVTAPAPPAPLAKLRVLEADSARLLDRVAREHPDSHLLLGVLYAQAGVRAEAEGHLAQVPPADRYFEVARRTRERLRTVAGTAGMQP